MTPEHRRDLLTLLVVLTAFAVCAWIAGCGNRHDDVPNLWCASEPGGPLVGYRVDLARWPEGKGTHGVYCPVQPDAPLVHCMYQGHDALSGTIIYVYGPSCVTAGV